MRRSLEATLQSAHRRGIIQAHRILPGSAAGGLADEFISRMNKLMETVFSIGTLSVGAVGAASVYGVWKVARQVWAVLLMEVGNHDSRRE
jgi:hypothetical protein